ncbi:MAG TPA: hypothetical protein VN936_01385 [Candidatus Acidoferrum sp.]|nr:hypothetical protein [Candidatus Acidoferrum sp.]
MKQQVRAVLFGVGALLLTGVDQTMPASQPASVAPVVTPAPVTSAGPVATPNAPPPVVMLPPDAAPQIQWIALSSTTPRSGDTLAVTVLASSNVASVELRVGGYGMGMNKTDVGRFESTSQVPKLPFFMNHNVTLQVIARNTAGVAIEQDIALQVL